MNELDYMGVAKVKDAEITSARTVLQAEQTKSHFNREIENYWLCSKADCFVRQTVYCLDNTENGCRHSSEESKSGNEWQWKKEREGQWSFSSKIKNTRLIK